MTGSKVVALGLDAGDPALLEEWLEQGHLPNLKKLLNQGSYSRLATYDWYRAETPWTTFLTGRSPSDTGYWSPIKYVPDQYDVKMVHAFDFEEFPPFYAGMPDKKVVIFDMPQGPLVEGLNGKQVLAWGTHSGQTASVSSPPELWQQIVEKHGAHPLLNNDGANCYDLNDLVNLATRMKTGIERRANASIDLIESERPDFFLTIFGEAHVAGHYFWHLGQPHPLGQYFKDAPNLLLDSFKAIDDAIGKIVTHIPDDTHIVIFSAHGMGTNVMDLPSVVFLPEVLYRINFPNAKAIGVGDDSPRPGPMVPVDEVKKDQFARAVWRRTREGSFIANQVKKWMGMRWYQRFAKHFPTKSGKHPQLLSPFYLRQRGDTEPFQCSTWFKEFWPQMKAFSLPSFSEGYIRINLKNREPKGVVSPADYNSVCQEITDEILKLKDARTGQPMVKRVIRTRERIEDETAKHPDADLVVVWQEDIAADTIESPTIGRIGPLPFLRTGSHRAGGFLMIKPAKGVDLQVRDGGHAIDIAPTFLKIMGIENFDRLEGKPLV